VFQDTGLDSEDQSRVISLLDYEVPQGSSPSWQEISLPPTHLVGLGAVGNAAVWALAHLPLGGTLQLVDPETVTLSNVQRYALTGLEDVGSLKAELAARRLAMSRIAAVPRVMTWSDYVMRDDRAPLDVVLTAVDGVAARIQAQAALPRQIFNGWTDADGLGVSSHVQFGSGEPCLACLYRSRKPRESDLQLFAKNVGFSLEETLNMLASRQSLSAEQVWRVEDYYELSRGALAAWQGADLLRFREEVVCGGIIAKLSGHVAEEEDNLVPLAHQSTMAGVVLVAEFLKRLAFPQSSGYPNIIRCRITRPLPDSFLFSQQRPQGDACFCTDEDFVEVWRKHWGDLATASVSA
jgi:molybdopterin/thiamine biosynthesis adenylyltransferase